MSYELSVKIRSIRVIHVPFFLAILFAASPLFAQLKNKIEVKLATSVKYTLSVTQINADTAYVRVLSKQGHAVRKLDADDFVITKDGDTANIISCTATTTASAKDLAITFVLDNSGSMFHSYDSLTKYLDTFIDSLGEGLTGNAMAFDNVERKRTYDGTNREFLFIASSEFTEDKIALENFWHSYDSIRTDLTPLYEATLKGLERIIDRRRGGDSLRREVMMVVTDGGDNASSTSIEKLSQLASVMPITLFTINYNSDPDGRLLWLAKKTHGDHYVANDLRELWETLDYLRKDIAYSYKLVFNFPFRGASGTH